MQNGAANGQSGSKKDWLCDFPWTYLYVSVQGEVSFCCTNTPKRGSLREQTFEEIWNGFGFQLARSQFRDRRYIPAKCLPSCQWLIANIPSHAASFGANSKPVYDDAGEQKRYQGQIRATGPLASPKNFVENLELQRRDIAAESSITAAMPTRAHIEIIQSCNLFCNFCDIGVNRPHESFIDDIVLDRLKPAYRYLRQVELLGGEIFSVGIERSPLRRILQDIQEATKDNPEPVETLLVTNAVALGSKWADFLTSLANIKLNISVSIDTLDPVAYPKMRVGGKLAKTLENVRALKRLADDRKYKLNLIFTSVLCDLTYRSIPQIVEFAQEMDAGYVMLQPLQKTGDHAFYDEHNLFTAERKESVVELKDILDSLSYERLNKANILTICNHYLA